VGAEALIRWQRGSEVVPPLDFIPLIENTPLSGLITYWVLDRFSRELADWLKDQDDVHMSINVPPEVFGRGGISYAVKQAGLERLCPKLVLEITERGMPDRIGIDALNSWPRRGALLALDDACTSRASMLVACRVPLDILKIEAATVKRMRNLSREEALALAELIHASNLGIIAEGVETADEAEVLLRCGIRMAQGWLFSRPLRAREFISYFAAHRHGNVGAGRPREHGRARATPSASTAPPSTRPPGWRH
jgi:EAL domain-containing protein (putative c-di-GMP-specific phosphodiesterase class I)